MKQYRLLISYDGTAYAGWQYQPHVRTITTVLQDIFAQVFNESIKILGASRTDAGVHAFGQVAVFQTNLEVPLNKMLFAWNNLLPDDIRIESIEEVAPDFHPYRTRVVKTYCYHIFTESPSPFVQRYGWHVHQPLNHELLKQTLALFVGTHDFAAFSMGHEKENTIRTIESIEVGYNEQLGAVQICFKGLGFLRHMIRRIVGAAVLVATKDNVTVEYVQKVLESGNQEHQLYTAPAKGLTLYHIEYQ